MQHILPDPFSLLTRLSWFHLRVYCVSKGDIQLFLYTRILALFSSVPYRHLSSSTPGPTEIDLRAHLTNTSLQTEGGETNVRLLDELEGCQFLSGGEDKQLSAADIDVLVSQIRNVLTDTFKSAVQHPIHFQVNSPIISSNFALNLSSPATP